MDREKLFMEKLKEYNTPQMYEEFKKYKDKKNKESKAYAGGVK